MAITIRDMVRAIQLECLEPLEPSRAAELLMRLSSLVGNCNDEIREADQAYAVHLLACLDTEAKANRAKIRAETSPEFARKRIARDTQALVVELIGSLKYLLKSKAEEMRLAR